WGSARWLALVILLLVVAGLIDWAVDRERDTPEGLRLFLSYFQIAAAAIAAFWFLLWPLRNRRSDSALALRVEEKYPRFHHRLITAVQLNRPGAAIEGMSAELIGVVTSEAVRQTRETDFAAVADNSRLKRGLAVTLGVLGVAALPFLLWPDIASTLLARQL